MGGSTNQTLPTIRFSDENLEGGSSSWVSTSKDVVGALEKYGCFIASYADFSPRLHHAIFGAAQELFDLPTHVKMLNTSQTAPYFGYINQEPRLPLYEGLGIQDATTDHAVQSFTTLVWPSGNQTFCETALEYSKAVAKLDEVVMRMVCEVYGIKNSYQNLRQSKSYLLRLINETALEYSKAVAKLDEVVMRMVCEVYGIKNSYQTLRQSKSYLLRLIKYRPPANHETDLGFFPHTDKTFMSFLHQSHVKGLHIKTKDDDWVVVDPSPSTFVVMAGDAVMGWSNGRIESPYHRVIMDGSEERYSIGVFTFIKDIKIQVPQELIDEDHPLQFRPFQNYDYLNFIQTEEGRRAKCPLKAFCGV